jgi:succinate-semialdehyde dehydrogenase/glutarate-semialdehyde dehydrogenase
VSGLEEAIELANNSPFGLGSSIFTRDLDAATIAAERLNAGYTWINSPQKIYDELPFGGVGESGFGKEHGIEALDYYTDLKSVVVKRGAA